MRILITAGGTTEKIDPVRKITNMATGRLGSRIAEEFVHQAGDRVETIYYVGEEGTAVPNLECLKRIRTEGVESVRRALTEILTAHRIDAVAHSMAVSDYAVGSLTTVTDLAGSLADALIAAGREALSDRGRLAARMAGWIRQNGRQIDRGAKVSSGYPDLLLAMRQTPKLIGIIKSLQPSAVLVGFKLLNGVTRRELLDAGYGVLRQNACDLVLANDLEGIGAGRHQGLLIRPDRSYQTFGTKEEIAQGIVRQVLGILDGRA